MKAKIFEEMKRKEEEMKMQEQLKASSAPKPVDAKAEAKATDGSVWNQNNYFWEEKNYSKWGDERLKEILNGFKHSLFGSELTVTGVEE
jgi:hypothetical protein